MAINRYNTSVTKSKQLDSAIPVSKIASLSSGEFVGMVADNLDQEIELKNFCCEVVNDHKGLEKEQALREKLPEISKIDKKNILDNYLEIKKDAKKIVEIEMERMMNTREMSSLIVEKL